MVELKNFSSKDGRFSLKVSCRECKNSFVQEFTIGSCPECHKRFNDKVKAKIQQWKEEGRKIEWYHELSAMIEVLDPSGKFLENFRKMKESERGS